MSKNYERDEREEYWRRPQQNRESQERWSGSGREDDYGWGAQGQEGRDWRRNEEYERRRWQEMRGREGGEGERGGWEGGRGRQWGNEDYDYGRERHYGTQGRNWPGGRGESNRGWEGGRLTATFRQPFDMLAVASQKHLEIASTTTAKKAPREDWLPSHPRRTRLRRLDFDFFAF